MKTATILKRPFLILALLLSASFAYSQNKPFPTIEDGPSWLVEVDSLPYWDTQLGLNMISVLGEENVCGYTYQVVPNKSFRCRELMELDSIMYYRVDGQKVFLRTSADCQVTEKLMYDFSVEIGDTTRLAYTRCAEEELEVVLINKSDTVISNRNRVVFEYKRPGGNYVFKMVEGIGWPEFPFYPMFCREEGANHYCKHDWVICLCSTQKGQYTYKGTYKPQFCDSLILNVQSPRLNIIGASAYYNEGVLTFKGFPKPYLSNSKWQLFNLQSGLVATGSQLSKTPLDLEAGVYLVFVKNKEGAVLLQQKMVVQ
ncbi:MAG: hypothetical protein ACI9YL_001370 [Luteibaculaceae bacterium]|jgi:hypothetical protein